MFRIVLFRSLPRSPVHGLAHCLATLSVFGLMLLAGCTANTVTTDSHTASPIEHQLMAEIAMQRGNFVVAMQQYLRLAQQSDDPEFARRATELAYEYGFDAFALSGAQRWDALSPADPAVHYYLGRLYVQRGSLDLAWESLQLALGPAEERSSGDYMALAADLTDSGNAARGLQLFQRFAQLYPDDAGISGSIAVLASDAGEMDVAIEAARKTIAIAPDWVVMRVWLARFLLAAGERASAFEQMAFALEMNPGLELELEFVGLIAASGEVAEALERAERLESRFPGSPDLQRARALILMQSGELPAARQEFMQLLADAFFVNECFWYLGQIAYEEGNLGQAIRYFSRVNSGSWLVSSRLGATQAFLALGEAAKAMAVQRDFAANFPKYAYDSFVPRAEILLAAGQADEALAMLKTAQQYKPWEASLWLYEGGIYEQAGDIDAAIAAFRQAVDYAPDNATALNALGYTLTIAGSKYADAYGYITRALELEPDNPAIMDSLGWVLYKQGKDAEALEWLERAYTLFPDPEVAAHLGELLWQKGDQDDATRIWMGALQEDPDNAVLNETIKRFME